MPRARKLANPNNATPNIESYSREELESCKTILLLETEPHSNMYRQIMVTRKQLHLLNGFVDKLIQVHSSNVEVFFRKRGSRLLVDLTFINDSRHAPFADAYTPDEIKKYKYKPSHRQKEPPEEDTDQPKEDDIES